MHQRIGDRGVTDNDSRSLARQAHDLGMLDRKRDVAGHGRRHEGERQGERGGYPIEHGALRPDRLNMAAIFARASESFLNGGAEICFFICF